jgi:hypothetical protein
MAKIAISIPRKLCDSMGEIHTRMTETDLVFEWKGPSKDDILEECFQ